MAGNFDPFGNVIIREPLTSATTSPDRLLHSVGALMTSAVGIEGSGSLKTAAEALREAGASLILVTEDGIYRGVLTQRDIASALAEGALPTDPVGLHAVERGTFSPSALGAEALRALVGAGVGEAAVVDPDGRPLGVLLAGSLLGGPTASVSPPVVGGMATPLGVYLTSGGISAGAPRWALILTGMAMFALVSLGHFVEIGARKLLPVELPLLADYALGILPLALFILLFRLTPLAGIHAAEHMAVNAIERHEPLVPEVVARMPRVHIRCGTNLAVGASLFIGISMTPWIAYPEVRLLVALLATMFLWKPLGTFAQLYVTTRRPNARQIESGIRAGRALLERYAQTGRVQPSIPARIWNSGLLHVMTGSFLMYGIVYGVGTLFGFDLAAI